MRRLTAAALITLAACTTTPTEPEDPAAKAREESDYACAYHRATIADMAGGVLTVPELRARFKEADSRSTIGTPEVRAAARAILVAATQDDGEAGLQAIVQMDKACAAAGH